MRREHGMHVPETDEEQHDFDERFFEALYSHIPPGYVALATESNLKPAALFFDSVVALRDHAYYDTPLQGVPQDVGIRHTIGFGGEGGRRLREATDEQRSWMSFWIRGARERNIPLCRS